MELPMIVALREAFWDIDPVGISGDGFPDDEYDREVHGSASRLLKGENPDEVAAWVVQSFTRAWGADISRAKQEQLVSAFSRITR
ncbi:hypothetical protein GCM10027404_33280 [Arthrobacter tumbae]